jgi:hypothetical protein
MFRPVDISRQLGKIRDQTRSRQEELLSEAKRILRKDLFTEKKILSHLVDYGKRFETLDEEDIDTSQVFTLGEIKTIATRQRLKFLDSKLYKPEMPYEAVLKIKELNRQHKKELKHFVVLSYPASFEEKKSQHPTLLFTKTNYDNYYFVHRWGKNLPWIRQILYWPLKNFENLLATVIIFTVALTLSLPTWLITLDAKADYWSGYRAAAFMHLLIFNAGVTAYITFAFTRNFSNSVWNRKRDFD